MDIDIQNISPSATVKPLRQLIQRAVVQTRGATAPASGVVDIRVSLDPQSSTGQDRCGVLKLPTPELARGFLRDFGGPNPRRKLRFDGKVLRFAKSKATPASRVPSTTPPTPPTPPAPANGSESQAHDTSPADILSNTIPVLTVQFGWECRDGKYSVEWEKSCSGKAFIGYNRRRREFHVKMAESDQENLMIVIHAAQVFWASSLFHADEAKTSLFFSLQYPPSYEREFLTPNTLDEATAPDTTLRHRLQSLDDHHGRCGPWAALAVRIECPDNVNKALQNLIQISRIRGEIFAYTSHALVHRGLFSPRVQRDYYAWIKTLQWEVAFQVEAITRDRLTDLQEMMSLRPDLEGMLASEGSAFTALFLRRFAGDLKQSWERRTAAPGMTGHVRDVYLRARRQYHPADAELQMVDERMGSFDCLHILVSPTSMRLQGPSPERSNRIIRRYWDHRRHFIRVSFVDEAQLQVQYRFDREVDTRKFIHDRFGRVLEEGVTIAGHHFEYLHYSQSGLRDHTFWFVEQFSLVSRNGEAPEINAARILADIGTFDDALRRCPARLGARYAQAFTATDPAVTVEAEEIHYYDDIMDVAKVRSFTDGVSSISPELAQEIRDALPHLPPSDNFHGFTCPASYQIRIGGSKGMVSVDYKLKGRVLGLRPSQIKFSAPDSRQIEVAAAFYKPGKFFLNRAVIFLFEGLGIQGGYPYLKSLQDAVVKETSTAVKSLSAAAKLMADYSLGTSYHLSSLVRSLHELGVSSPSLGRGYELLTQFLRHHVLRDLKYGAHIPAPGYTLPGIADVHGFLEEGQIFAFVIPADGSDPTYIEGPCLIFRSPLTHPGDMQVAHAIGRPPPGSPFEKEPLANNVVFSVKGARPLASCLSGGDMDGDVFVCTTERRLSISRPQGPYPPAEYKAAEKNVLDHPATKKDLIDFVVEFMYSHNIGIIATEWLLFADREKESIFSWQCLKLAALHSDATDYPKSGRPVMMHQIPRFKGPKPDWRRPEISTDDVNDYYPSKRWVGKLFNAVKMPPMPQQAQAYVPPHKRNGSSDRFIASQEAHRRLQTQLRSPSGDTAQLTQALRKKLSQYVDVEHLPIALLHDVSRIFEQYKTRLVAISFDFTLSKTHPSATEPLTEQEVVLSTIAAPCTQARRRKNLMAEMREQTGHLCRATRKDLNRAVKDGEPEDPMFLWRESLHRAWAAYGLSLLRQDEYGAESFGYVAMGEIFDTIESIDKYRKLQES